MNSTAAANSCSENATGSSRIVPSKAEGIALCTAFISACVFIAVGNMSTIILFAANIRLRKRSLFLVINMAFADLMLGTVTLPLYIYCVGKSFQLWNYGWSMSLSIFYTIVDSFFSQASLISAAFVSGERFYAIYWPFKHRTLSIQAYRTMIVAVWALTLVITSLWSASYFLMSYKRAVIGWAPFVLILIFVICGSNIGIWRKFRRGNIAPQQQNRDSQNKRLTKTLLLVSILTLLSCLPLIIFNCLIYVFDVQIPWKFYYLVNVINYSNSFANPVVYALRIPEFRKALVLCCSRRPAVPNIDRRLRTNKKTLAQTPPAKNIKNRDDLSTASYEQEVLDTKL